MKCSHLKYIKLQLLYTQHTELSCIHKACEKSCNLFYDLGEKIKKELRIQVQGGWEIKSRGRIWCPPSDKQRLHCSWALQKTGSKFHSWLNSEANENQQLKLRTHTNSKTQHLSFYIKNVSLPDISLHRPWQETPDSCQRLTEAGRGW